MSVVLDDKDMFRQMMEAAEPREILKKVLKQKKSYDRLKRQFISALNINPSTCEIVYCFPHTPYKRVQMADDTFLFLDKDYKILGVLKGSKWDKEWERFENYSQATSNYYSYNCVKKTRKAMQEKAFHILRFPVDGQSKKPIQVIDHNPIDIKRNMEREKHFQDYTRQANKEKKIFNYKVQKYNCLTFEDVKQVASDLLVYLSQYIHREKEIKNIEQKLQTKQVKEIASHYKTIEIVDVIRGVGSLYSDLICYVEDEHRYNVAKLKLIGLSKVFETLNK